jgi:D-arabinose 1-dehydrogenase-like Zn-dependent alcohol dehydrogenase
LTRSGSFVVFHHTGAPLELRRAALPPLGHGEILVRNVYATLCRSDVSTWSGKRREKSPTILGHEIVGRIDQLGPAAPGHDLRGAPLRVGDRVTWAVYASDPAAELAQRGMPQKAPDLFKYGHEQLTEQSGFHGGLAEFTVLRAIRRCCASMPRCPTRSPHRSTAPSPPWPARCASPAICRTAAWW